MMPAQHLQRSFRFDVEDGVATLLFDIPNEPVNTLSTEIAAELDQVLTEIGRDPAVRAVVFASGKRDGFIAGAKIEMLQRVTSAAEAEQLARDAQKGFERLERFPKPVVAAIHGACLGGGLELALACHWRIATSDRKTTLGLPEVQLGLIPGAGGTQRLPRLVGIATALDLILAGKTVKPKKALKIGLVDEVVPPPILIDVARQRARELADGRVKRVKSEGVSTILRTVAPRGASSDSSERQRCTWSIPGTVRVSNVIRASSGTELVFRPPRMVPTLSVGLPITGWESIGKWKCSRSPITFAILTMALSPTSGIEPCAVTPRVSTSNQASPLWPTYG